MYVQKSSVMRLNHTRIRERRELVGMSRPELARRLSAHNRELFWSTGGQQIKRWEEGQRMRGESRVVSAIAAVLGVPFEFFYDSDGDGEPALATTVTDDGDPSTVSVFTLEMPAKDVGTLLASLNEGVRITKAAAPGEVSA